MKNKVVFLLIFLVASSFFVSFVSATTGTMGNTTDTGTEYYDISLNQARGQKFQAPADATEVLNMHFYGRAISGTNYVKCFITDTSKNILTNGITPNVSVSTTAQTYTATFTTPPTITGGTYYILWVITYSTLRIYQIDTTNGVSYTDTSNSFSSPTNPTDASDITRNFRTFYADVTINDPTPTPSPTPTPTPEPTPPPAEIDNMINGLWVEPNTDFSTLTNLNFSNVYIQAGIWQTDGSISTAVSGGHIATDIADAESHGFNPYLWIGAVDEAHTVPLSTSQNRQTAINSLAAIANTYQPHGIADDIEFCSGSGANIIAYYNAAEDALQALGVDYLTTMNGGWIGEGRTIDADLFAQISVDRIALMAYGEWSTETREAEIKDEIDFMLTNANSPISIIIHTDTENLYQTLQESMEWTDEQLAESPTTDLAGIDVFWLSSFTQTQITLWSNWQTKDSQNPPDPTPTPTPTQAPTPTPTPTQPIPTQPIPTQTQSFRPITNPVIILIILLGSGIATFYMGITFLKNRELMKFLELIVVVAVLLPIAYYFLLA